jgi:hypothetical protein
LKDEIIMPIRTAQLPDPESDLPSRSEAQALAQLETALSARDSIEWADRVLAITDERHRSYAIRIADPRSLDPTIRAKLRENAASMATPEIRRATLDYLELGEE